MKSFAVTIPKRRPMSRRRRLKAKRWEAFAWQAKKAVRRNPAVSWSIETDKVTGLLMEKISRADGSVSVGVLSYSAYSSEALAIRRLVQ